MHMSKASRMLYTPGNTYKNAWGVAMAKEFIAHHGSNSVIHIELLETGKSATNPSLTPNADHILISSILSRVPALEAVEPLIALSAMPFD